MTEEEYNALVSVLQRAPVTQAELLALRAILAKLAPKREEGERVNGYAPVVEVP